MTKHVIINAGDKMTYQSLYRKYRPQHLSEVVGQKHILEVLENSLRKDMISHAYLFCGPRGTGKTSIAKLFAQSINCETQGEIACGRCNNCIEGRAGTHPDIVEIDAASNNGVDEIRGLIDRIKYTPILGKYKVYIIDEVHMLTAGAFNAFLKTLEEPPEHAVFVLATTEIHKVIPTIVSRCQRFDFSNLSNPAISGRLDYVLNEEDVKAEEGVTQLIASLSNGALRNALTILEQAIIVANPVITLDQVHDLNGVVTARQKYSLIQAILSPDMGRLNNEIEVLLENSVDIERLIMDLVETMKDAVIFQYTKSLDHAKYSEISLIEFLAPRVATKTLINMIETLLEYVEKMKYSHSQESYFQIALIKLFSQTTEGSVHVESEKQSEYPQGNKAPSTDAYTPNSIQLPHEKNIKPADVVLTMTANDEEDMDVPVHTPEAKFQENLTPHIERDYNEDFDNKSEVISEPIPSTNESLDLSEESMDIPVHTQEDSLDNPSIGHLDRDYNDEEENKVSSSESGLISNLDNSHEEVNSSLNFESEDQISLEIELKDNLQAMVNNLNSGSDLQQDHNNDLLSDAETTFNYDDGSEEADSLIIEDTIEEITISEEVEVKLGVESIVEYMVSANKDLRMIDEINYKKISNYINDFEWAKCARLLKDGNLVLSGDHFVMISLDQELEVNEIMDPSNNMDLVRFSSMLFNTEKRIYACTRDEFSSAVARFRELAASNSLPSPLSPDEIKVKVMEEEENDKDVKLKMVKNLFGSDLNIIE